MGCGTSSSQIVAEQNGRVDQQGESIPPKQSVVLEECTMYFQAGSGRVDDISKQSKGFVDIFPANGGFDSKFGLQNLLDIIKSQKKVTFVIDTMSYECLWLVDNMAKIIQSQGGENEPLKFILIVSTLRTQQYFTGPAGFQYNLYRLLSQIPKKHPIGYVERGAFYQADEKSIIDQCFTKLGELISDKSVQDGQRVCFYPDGKQLFTDLINTTSQINSRSWKKKFYSHIQVNESSEEAQLLQGMQRIISDLVKDLKGQSKILTNFGQLPPKQLYFQSVPPKQKLIVQIGTQAITLKRFLTGKKVNLADLEAVGDKLNTELLFLLDQNATIEDLSAFKKIVETSPLFKAVVYLFPNEQKEWLLNTPILETIFTKADLVVPLNVDNPKNGEFLKALSGSSISLTEMYYHLVCQTKFNILVPHFDGTSLFKTNSKPIDLLNKPKNLFSSIIFGAKDLATVQEKHFSQFSSPSPAYRVPSMINSFGLAFSSEIANLFPDLGLSLTPDQLTSQINTKWNDLQPSDVKKVLDNLLVLQKDYQALQNLKDE